MTVADLVQHAGDVVYINTPIKTELLTDFDELAKVLAAQPHNFEGKRTSAYHILSYGYYINELVRRSDPLNRTIGNFIRDEIAIPLNLDFF